MPDAPAVAVVVCAYTPQRTASVLAAVTEARRQCDGPRDEVVLVVDHAPELAAALTRAVPDGVAVVESTGPRGLSGARAMPARWPCSRAWRDGTASPESVPGSST